MKKDDDKGMLNEILPDPKQAERDLARGSPRDRTSAHLRRIVAAAAAALLPLQGALADNSVPGDKTKEDKKKGADTQKPPDTPPPQPPGYGVVDPMPMPYVNPSGKTGILRVLTKPAGATVLLDGEDLGQKTPINKYKLGVGPHTITVTSPDGTITKNLGIDMKAGQTVKEWVDLRPPKAPKK
jgi:hypothetical protein